eukprot:359166-Alexandrium_andersonii.AAC.1
MCARLCWCFGVGDSVGAGLGDAVHYDADNSVGVGVSMGVGDSATVHAYVRAYVDARVRARAR